MAIESRRGGAAKRRLHVRAELQHRIEAIGIGQLFAEQLLHHLVHRLLIDWRPSIRRRDDLRGCRGELASHCFLDVDHVVEEVSPIQFGLWFLGFYIVGFGIDFVRNFASHSIDSSRHTWLKGAIQCLQQSKIPGIEIEGLIVCVGPQPIGDWRYGKERRERIEAE